jgi:hypothetical protein
MKLSNILKIIAMVLVLASVAWAGRKAPPVTVNDLDDSTKHGRDYPPVVIAEYNLQRTLNESLSIDDRVESFRVVRAVNAPIHQNIDLLTQMTIDPDTPEALKTELLAYLQTNDYSDSGEFMASALADPNLTPATRQSLLNWAANNGDIDMYTEVVKVWAQQPANGANETTFRELVEELSGNDSWSTALMTALGTQGFMAKGSALEVLISRLTTEEMATEIRSARPTHISIATLQTFLKAFDYIPQSRQAFITAVYLYKSEQNALNPVASLYRKWHRDSDYTFSIGDFPLLKEIARDPTLMDTSRVALLADIAGRMGTMDHQTHYTGGDTTANSDARLPKLKDDLTMADLWRISLAMDLLARPSVRAGLEYLADRDQADTTTAWGGLLFFKDGTVEARRYPPLKDGQSNDLTFRPTARMLSEARGSIGRFVCHFDDEDNADRVGPTLAELASARVNNFAALSITRLDANQFTAHYYNSEGEIVSLGTYQFTPQSD